MRNQSSLAPAIRFAFLIWHYCAAAHTYRWSEIASISARLLELASEWAPGAPIPSEMQEIAQRLGGWQVTQVRMIDPAAGISIHESLILMKGKSTIAIPRLPIDK